MVAPVVAAAGISAAAGLLGSIFGGRSSRRAQEEANRQNQAINEQNAALQREFAQNGIRWKVEDARAAGLHPLYALGGSGATYTPSSIPIMPKDDGSQFRNMGQDVSRAAMAFGEKEIQSAQIEALKAAAAKDYALASAAASESARFNQQMTISPADVEWFKAKGMPIPGQAQSFPVPSQLPDTGKPLPANPPAYLTSSVGEPGFRIFNVPGLGQVILPNASNMAEAVESLENPVLQAAVAAANAAHYGPGGAKRLQRLMGRSWSDPVGAGVDWLRSKVPEVIRR